MDARPGVRWLVPVIMVVVITAGLFLWLSNRESMESGPTALPGVEEEAADGQGAPVDMSAGEEPEAGLRIAYLENVPPPAPLISRQVAERMAEFRSLYGAAGSLNYEDARRLVEERKEHTEEISKKLAALGADGVQSLLDAYGKAERTREKMLVIDALARNPDPVAVDALTRLLEVETLFSMRQEMVRSLSRHPADKARAALTEIATKDENSRLRIPAVQGLSRWQGSLPTLAERVRADTDQVVQMEAIRAIGILGSEAAKEELQAFCASELEPRVRQQAIMEVVRTFPDSAYPVLERMSSDEAWPVRVSTVRGLARLGTDAAVQLLETMAQSDSSEIVRTLAGKKLAELR